MKIERLSQFWIASIAFHGLILLMTLGGSQKIYRQGPIEVELAPFHPSSGVQKKKTESKPRFPERKVPEAESGEVIAKKAPPLPLAEASSGGPPIAGDRNTSASGTIFDEEMVDVPATLVFEPKIRYPARALRDGVEGQVLVTIVVTEKGIVSEAELLRRAGYGFDEEALRAAKLLKFNPAHKDGKHVPVRIVWTCRFQIES